MHHSTSLTRESPSSVRAKFDEDVRQNRFRAHHTWLTGDSRTGQFDVDVSTTPPTAAARLLALSGCCELACPVRLRAARWSPIAASARTPCPSPPTAHLWRRRAASRGTGRPSPDAPETTPTGA